MALVPSDCHQNLLETGKESAASLLGVDTSFLCEGVNVAAHIPGKSLRLFPTSPTQLAGIPVK
jgi:hypothetical protein